jgi:DNA polymerase-1
MSEERLILIDGMGYLYRAFHALPSLTNSNGEPTGAIHGVVAMIRRLISDHRPTYVGVVFDAPGKTFRDDMYPEYKANRPPMDDEMRAQIEPLYALIDASGLPRLTVPGVEADDVIGTLAIQARAEKITTIISTGDKDMTQLVGGRITLVNTMNDSVLDSEGVVKKFGVLPEQIIDYLTLVGDSVDNVPGVPKVGPKTAVKWLTEYGSLDAIIENADAIKGKVGENLRATLPKIPLSRQLVTIVTDLELGKGPRDLKPTAPQREVLKEIYTRLEFKTWLRELLANDVDLVGDALTSTPERVQAQPPDDNETTNSPAATETKVGDYEIVLDKKAFNKWLMRLKASDLIAFDTETTSLEYMSAELVGVSFAVTPGEAAYVPIAHDYPGAPTQLTLQVVLDGLRAILEDPAKAKLGHNLKYDRSVLANYGIELAGIDYDTMLESYVLDSTATRHDMDSLALKYLGTKTTHFEDVAGKGAKQLTFNQVALDEAGPYAAEDADITLRLHQHLWPKLTSQAKLLTLFNTIEIPLVPVLSRIERNGVQVDAGMLAKQSAELSKRMHELETESYEVAGQPFNMGSPKQIQAILFDKQGLPVLQKTPKGQPSTAESVLQELAEDFPLPKLILEHRGLSKLKSTYTDKLPLQINKFTGRVHTSYHQAVAATGRLSSSDPNLQNIPIRSREGRRIRQAFVAPPGYVLLAADYSQIELRIMAHLSQDEGLCTAFSEGADIHRSTAAEVFEIPLDQVPDEQRRAAKAINFGLIYGMSAFGLARQLGIERRAAQDYVDRYFARYPGVKAFMDTTRERAKEEGHVETVFGRRLYLPEINSRNAQRRQYAERTAINAPMQGTAADIIKRAMLSVDAWLQESKTDARIIMQVHDELVLEVAEGVLSEATEQVCALMSQAAELSVPLVVDAGHGSNWDQAH